jgi:hypothetical protein
MADATQFLESVRAGLSQDGIVAELQMVRANGKVACIQFPAAAAASIMLNIEQALGTPFEKQRAMLKGEDPRAFFQAIGGFGGSTATGIAGAGGAATLSQDKRLPMRVTG